MVEIIPSHGLDSTMPRMAHRRCLRCGGGGAGRCINSAIRALSPQPPNNMCLSIQGMN